MKAQTACTAVLFFSDVFLANSYTLQTYVYCFGEYDGYFASGCTIEHHKEAQESAKKAKIFFDWKVHDIVSPFRF